MWLFELRKKLSTKQALPLQLGGLALFFGVWVFFTNGDSPIIKPGILPSPFKVINSYGELYNDKFLIKKMFRSIGLNLAGYIEALLLAIPIGFLIGLIPLFRGAFERYANALRFVPLTALTGLFIIWFGIGTGMKVHFLAFGIMIYLLPVVIQRIDEVKDVYLKTVYTLGANSWQTITTVYIPSVMSRVFDDIRVLTAISWTYIIVAEGITSEEGLGSMIFNLGKRRGRADIVFAVVLLIVLIGVVQDKLFVAIDKGLFPHKYQTKKKYPSQIKKQNPIISSLLRFARSSLVWILIGLYLLLTLNEYFSILAEVKLMDYLFADTVWAVHISIWAFIVYKIHQWNAKRELLSFNNKHTTNTINSNDQDVKTESQEETILNVELEKHKDDATHGNESKDQ